MRRHPTVLALSVSVLLATAACSDDAAPDTAANPVAAAPSVASAPPAPSRPPADGRGWAFGATLESPRSAARQAGLAVDGAVDAISWSDRTGFMTLVLTESGTLEVPALRADLVVQQDDGTNRVLRTVRDGSPDCEFDALAEFVPDSLGVHDDDGDGIGEVTFAYRTACRSDVSPSSQKLLVLEGDARFILRGESSGDVIGKAGPPEPEPAAGAWPVRAYDRALADFAALPDEFTVPEPDASPS